MIDSRIRQGNTLGPASKILKEILIWAGSSRCRFAGEHSPLMLLCNPGLNAVFSKGSLALT